MSLGEVVDILDEHGTVIGSATREEVEANNHTIKNVVVFLFNSLGAVWKQKRPTDKREFKGLWDVTACGAIGAGEGELLAAKREVHEETAGLTPELRYAGKFLNTFTTQDGQETTRLTFLYFGVTDEIPRPNQEVDEFVVQTPEDAKADALKNPDQYVPSFVVELDRIYDKYRALTE